MIDGHDTGGMKISKVGLALLPCQSALADPTSLPMGVIMTVFEMKMREDYVRRIRDRQLFCMMI